MYTSEMNRLKKTLSLSLCFFAFLSGPAFSHAAQQGFVLLLPTTAYITAGTLAVALTILLLLSFRGNQLRQLFRPRDTGIARSLISPSDWTSFLASLSLALLIFVGLFGPTDPQANLLPLVIWTFVWMALFVIQGVLFDIWAWVNPWVGIHRLLYPSGDSQLTLRSDLSIWPAVLLFAAFQSFVLADVAPNDPDRLAKITLGYSIFTLIGMSLFGREVWLRQVECFTVLFNIIGKMRLFRKDDSLRFGLPGWQALKVDDWDLSHAIFILIILAAGSFDGLHETFWWLGKVGVNPLEYPGRTAMFWTTLTGLFASIWLLICLFVGAIWVGLSVVSNGADPPTRKLKDVLVRFSMTLLPIAIGYHAAHYFVTFLVQIQVVVATLADPLATGWNLFGLGNSRVKVGFLSVPATVKLIWLTQASVVVISHILAVLLSHRIAEQICDRPRDVIRLQIGLSILMIAYTVFGLWLLASPRGV